MPQGSSATTLQVFNMDAGRTPTGDLKIGNVVKYKEDDAIILDVQAPLGFRQFRIMKLTDGKTLTVSRHQIDAFQEENIEDWMTEPIAEQEPEISSINNRFPNADSKEIDDLASARLSVNTRRQTDWAVKVLKGE